MKRGPSCPLDHIELCKDRIVHSEANSSARPELAVIHDPEGDNIYYRLQMGTGPLSEAYVDGIFERAMKGLGIS